MGADREDMMQGQVIRAAQQLYQQHGLHKVTMKDVARAVGKGKSSLYYYYKSKEEIFGAVIDVEIREILAEIDRAVQKAVTTKQKIQAFCAAKLRISKKRRSTFNAMDMGMSADELSSNTKARHAVHKQFRKQETAYFRNILTQGIAKGEVRAMDEQELDLMVFVILSSSRGLKREIVEEDSHRGSGEAACKALASLVMKGLKR